jgi:hypothetical protein
MNISEAAVAAAITVSVAGISYVAFGPDTLTGTAQTAADKATCRGVDAAVVGYVAVNDRLPRSIADLRPYVKGDITKYRIVDGVATGPGC